MRVTRHGDNLWQLTRLIGFNCYLVRERDGLTAIDTNMTGSHKGIAGAAREIGLPIRRIALTHAHTDHAGSLDDLAALVPDAEVALTSRTAEFLRGNVTLLPSEPQSPIKGGFVVRTTQASRLLQPGDVLGSLRVLAAPGHAPDQIAFFDERDGTLIAGDAFQTIAGTSVSGVMRWLFPFTAMATWHLPTALETAWALRTLNPGRLAVGHGQVLEQPIAEMDRAIAEMDRAISEAEEKVFGEAETAQS